MLVLEAGTTLQGIVLLDVYIEINENVLNMQIISEGVQDRDFVMILQFHFL